MNEAMQQYQETLAWLETEPLLTNLENDDPAPMVWYRRKMPGCVNAGGSGDCMYLKKGTSDGLVIFLIGGGMAFNAEMAAGGGTMKDFFVPREKPSFFTDECHPGNELYFFKILENRGLFSLENENPFSTWSVAMINYGTADFHIGGGDHTYTDENGETITLHHHGYHNFREAMKVIQRLFPAPKKLLITGGSAGAFGASALGAEIAESFPEEMDVTICPDSACLEMEEWPSIVRDIWKAPDHIAEAAVSRNFVLDMYRMTQKRLGGRAKYMFMIGYPDSALSMFQNYVDEGGLALTADAERRYSKILKGQVLEMKQLEYPVHIYLHHILQNGSVQHCVLDSPASREGEISPLAWLYAGVNGDLSDVGFELLEKDCCTQ